MNFSEMSSTTIFSIALLAVLVILLIVLVIVTIKVLSKGKKGDDEYTERRYTSRRKDKYDSDEEYDDEDDEEDEEEDERVVDRSGKEPEDDYREEDSEDNGEEEYDEPSREAERKNDVASVVEAALQAKAKAAEFEARVAREKARVALEEAELATKRASEAEAEARAASGRDISDAQDEEEEEEYEEEVSEEEYEEEQPEEDYEEDSEDSYEEEDTTGTTDELKSGEPEETEEEVEEEAEEEPEEEPDEDEEEARESAEPDEDLMKANTRVADAAKIVEAVKRARRGKRFSEEPVKQAEEESAEQAEEEQAEQAEEEPAEEQVTAAEDSAFADSAFAIPADSEDKKKIDTTFDSAFTDPELNKEPEPPVYEDSAFGSQEPDKEEEEAVSLQVAGETITVNPVNQVNIRTVNSVEPVNTTNEEAGIHDMAEMNDFLSENPIPRKERRKLKKKDAIFAKKFDSDAPRIRGAKYLWYNNQDIEGLNKKEDIYYHCHYFNDPREAVLPLVIEMYDCAFVRTEEIQRIAYGIKYQSMGLREILTAKENISFNRSKVEKDPTEQDIQKIREKWCDYVDNFLQIIEIQAPDDIQDYIKDQLYAYGEHDVDTLLFCPDPEDDED